MTAPTYQGPVPDAREYALWLLHRLAPQRGVGNIAAAVSVDAAVDHALFADAVATVIARHPRLRSTFAAGCGGDGDPAAARLQVLPEAAKSESVERCVPAAQLPQTLAELCTQPFADGALLARAALLRAARRSVLCIVMNQLVASGPPDAEAVLGEVIDVYNALNTGAAPAERPAELSAPRPRPRAESVRYWTDELGGVDPGRLSMSTARPLSSRPTFAGDLRRRSLGSPWRTALAQIAARHAVTPTAVLLTLYAMLLAQHGSGPDLVIGVPARTAASDTDAPPHSGSGENLLPIRIRVEQHACFSSLLYAASATLRRAAEHAEICVEDLPAAPKAPASRWWTPWYHHALDVRGAESPLRGLHLAGRPVRPLPAAPQASSLDVHLAVAVTDTGIDLEARFSTEAHTAADIEAFLERYAHLLLHIQDTTPTDEPLLSTADRALIASANTTERELPQPSVANLVLAQARRTPDALAVDDTSYRDLASLAADVKERLTHAGVRPGAVVAVSGPRGADLAAAMLGTWMAGGAYLPVGADAPPTRVHQQLDEAHVAVVLRTGQSPVPGARTVIDMRHADRRDPNAAPGPGSRTAAAHAAPPGDAATPQRAYVLFTSGSTGRPKGVAVSHPALANLVTDMMARLPVRCADRVLWSTAVSFDISALEIWTPLCAGAHVRTVPDALLLVPGDLLRFVEQEHISILQGTPTLWQHLAPDLGNRLRGRLVLVGGEPLPATLAERLITAGARVRNMYGPTETTIWSTTAPLTSPVPQPVPIGLPIANTRVHVLDHQGRPVFPGTPGELGICGLGLADGYLGDPDLTRARFPTDPVHGRYYRTGDRVLQRPDGVLEFLGREDRQVKIRGHRVELVEVEAALASHPQVGAAAVVTETDPSGRLRLTAAVSSTERARDLVPQLHQHAAGLLPRPAVPARITVVPALPATPNGKTDYAAIRHLVSIRTSPPDQAAQDPLLQTLITLWSTELTPGLTATADFFHHGGSARQALAFTARLSRHTGRPLPFDAVFRAPTPETMHRLLTAETRR